MHINLVSTMYKSVEQKHIGRVQHKTFAKLNMQIEPTTSVPDRSRPIAYWVPVEIGLLVEG